MAEKKKLTEIKNYLEQAEQLSKLADRPTHKLFLLNNDKPHASAHDNAFWLRQKQIEFPFTFVDE